MKKELEHAFNLSRDMDTSNDEPWAHPAACVYLVTNYSSEYGNYLGGMVYGFQADIPWPNGQVTAYRRIAVGLAEKLK